jgi:hypothetical protein
MSKANELEQVDCEAVSEHICADARLELKGEGAGPVGSNGERVEQLLEVE